jgi:hypothetical protein
MQAVAVDGVVAQAEPEVPVVVVTVMVVQGLLLV